jgi:hypothetical protein
MTSNNKIGEKKNTLVGDLYITVVREGVPQRQDNKFQTKTLEKETISGQTSTKWARHQDILTDCQP